MKNFLKLIQGFPTETMVGGEYIRKFAEAHAKEIQKRDHVRYPGKEWEEETVKRLESETLQLLLDGAEHFCKKDEVSFEAESLATGYALVKIDGYQYDVFVRKVKRD